MEKMTREKAEKRLSELREYIKPFGRVAVAFSGGVDSSLLLYAAFLELGNDVVALTASMDVTPVGEADDARDFCERYGITQKVIDIDVFGIEGFKENHTDRCYTCKKALFTRFINEAESMGIKAVLEGSNADDKGDYRPGLKAISELGVISPYLALSVTKDEIRAMADLLKLDVFNKPSGACLASRIPYGDVITVEKLYMTGRAEKLITDMGFSRVRVRLHDSVARIELDPADLARFIKDDVRIPVYKALKEFGFSYVTLDVLGYRTGSMNEMIGKGSVNG